MLLRSSTRERTLLPRCETSFITTYISLYRYYSNFGTKCLSQSITVMAEQSRSISSIDNKIYVHARTFSLVRKQKQEIGMIEEEIRFYEGRPSRSSIRSQLVFTSFMDVCSSVALSIQIEVSAIDDDRSGQAEVTRGARWRTCFRNRWQRSSCRVGRNRQGRGGREERSGRNRRPNNVVSSRARPERV